MTAKRLNPMSYIQQRTVLLTSFKRDGTPVGTPVHIAVDGGRVYVRSYEKAWKTKRIRRDPRIEIAPSTVRGEPTGPAVEARAHPRGLRRRTSRGRRSGASTRSSIAG